MVVDLDGTLLKGELPWESFLEVLCRKPFSLIPLFLNRLLRGNRVSLKMHLEKAARLDLKQIPVCESFLSFLKGEKARGRTLFLCTGSTQSYADQVTEMIPLFDAAYGSVLGKNLVGRTKATFLKEKWGAGGFDYAGNALVDVKVARVARRFIIVKPSAGLRVWLKFQTLSPSPNIFCDRQRSFSELVGTLGGGFWFLNTVFYMLCFMGEMVFFSASDPGGFPHRGRGVLMSWVSLNCLATACYVFFLMHRMRWDRKNQTGGGNLFARGDLSLVSGFFISGAALVLFFGAEVLSAVFDSPSFRGGGDFVQGFSEGAWGGLFNRGIQSLGARMGFFMVYGVAVYTYLYRIHRFRRLYTFMAVCCFLTAATAFYYL